MTMMDILHSDADPYLVELAQDKNLKAGCSGNGFCGPVEHIDEDGPHKEKEPAEAKLP